MATGTILERGMLVHDLPAQTLDGGPVHASDFRGRRNLVLIFPGVTAEESLLVRELRQQAADLQEEEAVALLAADVPAELLGYYGAISNRGERRPALYITDRYGEIYYAAHGESGGTLPSAAEVLDWLRFINSQCPE